MADVYFTTNPAEFTRLEGLYVSERNPPGFIRARDLSVVAMAGKCVRGPLTPVEITSPARFLEIYGGRDYTANGTGGARVGEVHAALLNKRFGKVVVRRVAAAADVAASFDWETAAGGGGTAVLRIAAANVGVWGNDVQFKIADASDAVANHFKLTIKYLGREVVYDNLDITTGNDNLAVTVGTDEGNLVVLTKLASGRPINTAAATDGADALAFVNLGETVAAFTSVAGTSGAPAVTDYNTGMNEIAQYPGVSVCLVPEAVPTPATYNGNLVTLAAQVSDRMFLTWSQVHGQSVATEVTNIGAQITTRSDRIVWAYNSTYTLDPDTGVEFQQGPHVWLAGIMSQTDVDIHPGAFETLAFNAGIKRLTNMGLQRPDLISLRDAGIASLERIAEGFWFRSGVTTNLTPGLTEITRRRMADFLQLSASDRLRSYVKARNTDERRATMAAELTAFSRQLKADKRVIEDFAIDQVSVNTAAQRAQGIEKILWRVKTIGHMLHLVFETEIGTGVVIDQAAA